MWVFWVRSVALGAAQTDTAVCVGKTRTDDRCKVLGRIFPDIWVVGSTVRPDSDDRSTLSVVTDSITTESAAGSSWEEVKDTSLPIATLVENGVLLVSTVAGGGFIMVQLLKELRKSTREPNMMLHTFFYEGWIFDFVWIQVQIQIRMMQK